MKPLSRPASTSHPIRTLLHGPRRLAPAFRVLPAVLLLALAPRVASARLVIVGETVHRATVAPGGLVSGTITILNRDATPAEVRIYQTDYRFAATGESDFAPAGSLPRSNARWLTLDASQRTIAPQASVEINYRGTVPTSPGPEGTYWSLVMVEQTEQVPAPPAARGAQERQAAIRTVIRHAVQIVSDLGTPTPPSLAVLRKSLDHDSRTKVFTLDVENRGNWMVRPAVSLELFDAQGAPIARRDAATARIYPGCSFRYRFDLEKLPRGQYTALAVLDTGDENVSGAQYTLDLP